MRTLAFKQRMPPFWASWWNQPRLLCKPNLWPMIKCRAGATSDSSRQLSVRNSMCAKALHPIYDHQLRCNYASLIFLLQQAICTGAFYTTKQSLARYAHSPFTHWILAFANMDTCYQFVIFHKTNWYKWMSRHSLNELACKLSSQKII